MFKVDYMGTIFASICHKLRRFSLIGIAISALIFSGCAPFQVNLPGSCSIFSNPETSQTPQHEAPTEKKKKGFFRKH